MVNQENEFQNIVSRISAIMCHPQMCLSIAMGWKCHSGNFPTPSKDLGGLQTFILAVWYKTKFGSQNFGYQIWFYTRLFSK